MPGNSFRMLCWMLIRAGALLAIIILITQLAGPTNYGKYVTIYSVSSFFTPFIGLGLSQFILSNGAREKENINAYFSKASKVWAFCIIPGSIIGWIISISILPDGLPIYSTAFFITAEASAYSYTELSARYYQAKNEAHKYGGTLAGLPICRLIALSTILFWHGEHTLEHILWAHSISGIAYICVLHLCKKRETSTEHKSIHMPITSGLPFSFAALALRLQSEINKPVLAQLKFESAGNFSLSQRTVELMSMPLVAFQEALWPRLYAHKDPLRQLKQSSMLLICISIMVGFLIWIFAPAITIIFGRNYEEAIHIARVLAWLPTLQSLRGILNFYAILSKRVKSIGYSHAAGALIGIFGVYTLVPQHGIYGAAIAAYLAEGSMIVTLILLFKLKNNFRNSSQ